PAGLPALPGGVHLAAVALARRRRGPAAAATVGVHIGEGPALPGHRVRGATDRPRGGQHHAGADAARLRRPRRDPPGHRHRCLPGRPAGAGRPGRVGHRLPRRGDGAGARGRGEVRGELAAAARDGAQRARGREVTAPELAGTGESAAGLTVWGADAVPGATTVRDRLQADSVPALLAGKDPTLWGPEAEPEARIRLGWVDTVRRSRGLVDQLAELDSELADLDHVVLAGMGGSSLAPEVIARTLGKPLTVLDTTDPHQIRAALADRLSRTVVVVASKPGTTVGTDSHRGAYHQAFLDAGFTEAEAGRRFVVVTDPGSPLVATATQLGSPVVLADPEVGGRYSALTAFGLVPAALLGVDIAELCEQAAALLPSLAKDRDNPALALGAALGAAGLGFGGETRDKVALVEDGTGIVGLGDWAEQLLAESTGKDGRGLLPVVVE